MPVCADPNDTAPLFLKSDKKLPPETRPTFRVRFLTDSEVGKIRRLLDQASKEKEEPQAKALVEEALRVGIVDVENLKFRGDLVRFSDIKKFNDLLSPREMWELAYGQIVAVSIAEDERFFSASQPDSAPERSAPDAEAAAR